MTPEERSKFKTHFLELSQGRIISPTNTYWQEYWTSPTSSEDVYESITASDIRTVRNSNKINFILLIRILCDKIITSNIDNLNHIELLNCVRFLTKLTPFVFEIHDFETVVFWTREFDPIEYSKHEPTVYPEQDCHAIKLVSILISLLFVEDFTTGKTRMWEPGIGQRLKYEPPNVTIDSNRSELLKLLILLCSNSMYTSIIHISSTGSKFLSYLVTSIPKIELLHLVCSLINVVCRASRSSLDENGLIFDTPEFTQVRHVVVTYSIQLLTLLVTYPLPNPELKLLVDSMIITGRPVNLARSYLGKIYKEHEIAFLVTSLINILRFPVIGDGEQLAKQNQPSIWATETVMLIWELIQCNKHFKHLIIKKYIPELFVIVLYYPFTFNSSNVHGNLVRVCSYLMLYLSSEDINDLFYPMSSSLYDFLPSSYKLQTHPLTTRDFLICQICNCIIGKQLLYLTNKHIPDILAKTLVEILYNLIQPVSSNELTVHNDPFKKLNNPNPRGGISYPAANHLTNLINKFSNRQFLLETPFHATLLALIIRAITNTVTRYPGPSRMLLFSILKNEKQFIELKQTMDTLLRVHFKHGVIERIDNTPEVVSVQLPLSDETLGIATPINREEEQYMTEDEIVAESLRPIPPKGMTQRSREKMKKNTPLGKSWGGDTALKMILEVIIPKLHDLIDDTEEDQILKLIQIIESVEFGEEKFEQEQEEQGELEELIRQVEEPLQPLRFSWSHLSLGWYMSLLFHEIYNSSEVIKNFMKGSKSITSSISSFSWILWESKPQVNTGDLEYVKNSLSNYNPWNNTNIRLFKLEVNESFLYKLGAGVQSLPNSPKLSLSRRVSELLNTKQNKSSPILSIGDSVTPIHTPTPTRPELLRKISRNSTSLQSLNKINRTRSNTVV